MREPVLTGDLVMGWQVSTKDGVLVARHGLTLDDSTDVASRPEFAARHRTQVRRVHSGGKA